MKADDARGRTGAGRQFLDRQRGSVRGEDRGVRSVRREVRENLLFDLELFRGGFDHDLHVAHHSRLRGSDDAGATFLRLRLVHQAALHRVGVSLLDVGQAAIDRRGIDVAQDDRNAARAEPLRDAGAHDAGADHGGMRNFSGAVFEEPLRYLSARKKLRIRFCVASVAPSSLMASTSIASDSSTDESPLRLMIS